MEPFDNIDTHTIEHEALGVKSQAQLDSRYLKLSGGTMTGVLTNTVGIILSKIYPASNSTTAIQINKADGTTNVVNIDTTNGRVGIGTTSPSAHLQVTNTSDTIGQIIKGYSSQTANLQEWQNSSGTVLSSINSSGYLKINTTSFSGNGEVLKVAKTVTATSGSNNWGTYINTSLSPSATSSATVTSLYVQTAADTTNYDLTGTAYGSYYQSYTWGSHNVGSLVGMNALTENYSSGTLGNMTSFNANQFIRSGGGNITNVYGYTANLSNQQSGSTIGTYKAFTVNTPTLTAGSLTNAYGLYINGINNATNNNYAIYTNSGLNRLGDQLSIVGSQDTKQLVVKGYSTQTSNLAEFQNSSGTVKASIDNSGNLDAVAYKVGGTAGVSGTFTTTDGKTITISNGICTSIV